MNRLTLKDLPLKGKTVLMRVDFNVPLNPDGTIADDSKIKASIPSIEYILQHDAALILMSHLGRPEGRKNPKFSLAPCQERLAFLLQKQVQIAPDCVGPEVEKMVAHLKPGQILLLENLRFHEGEEEPEKDPSFITQLASLGDFYVNDAFGSAHRAHASTALIAKQFPHKAAAGLLMEKEILHLSPLLQAPARPFYALIGGSKVSSKSGVIHNLLKKIDSLFLGGAMAFTFLKAKGIEIGESLFEPSEVATAKEILSRAQSIHLPLDFVIADSFEEAANTKIISADSGIPPGWRGMDIGPETVREWSSLFRKAATIFWNGPLGVFELPSFSLGTKKIAENLASLPAQVIVGGGDSIAAIQKMGLTQRFAYLSTGGGASLEFLEFGHLPGIDALSLSS